MRFTASPAPARNMDARALEFESAFRSGLCSMKYDAQATRSRERTCLKGVRAGAIDVLAFEGDGVQIGRRSHEHIRNDWADNFIICMPLTARFEITQNGRDSQVGPGSFVFLQTTQPFDASVRSSSASDGAFSSFHLRLPGPMLRARVPQVDRLCNRLFDTGPGAGRILKSMMESSFANVPLLTGEQAAGFGAALFDIVAGVVLGAEEGGRLDRVVGRGAWRQNVIEKANAFIERNLSDPRLDTAMVARHCRISVRYLHAAFSISDLSVASTIREMRLQRCRQALREPRLRCRTLMEIACSWGFGDQSHFSRCYRARFGIAPNEDRKRSD